MRWLRIRVGMIAAVCAAITAFAAYVLFQDGPFSWLLATCFLLFTVWIAVALPLFVSAGSRRLQSRPRDGGVGLSNSRGITVVLALLTATCFMAVIGLVLTWMEPAGRAAGFTGSFGFAIVLGLFLAVGIPAIATIVHHRMRGGGLLLMPELIAYQTFTRRRTVAWADVVSVWRPAGRNSVILVSPRASPLSIPCGLLRISPAALADFLEHYRSTPTAREELSGHRALERFEALAEERP
ncbi:hypothetical protein [Sediminivirga luteola]|uniref:hypothetical protein n=1 Tax=Sediminivirga luteola TaxID=1774748 RepID=UPI001F59F679|nr:hypothetical protein [Sediminivirga luteola]MCI2264484.1 hypothetical protein [Sediminivirga luteola]